MGFFGKIFKKKDNFDFDTPPDFSGGSDPFASDATGKEPFGGKDPLQNDFSYDQQAPLDQQSNFNHDLFTNDQPTNADNARNYAQGLATPAQHGQSMSVQGQQSVGQPATSAISGHEAELILERLDTIKAELDAIKQRMLRIERYMDSSEQKGSAQRRYF